MTANNLHLPWRNTALIPGKPEIRTSITDEERGELQHLAKGRHVLEIGSAHGYSAIAMALGGALSVVAVDPHEPHITNEDGETLGHMTGHLKAYEVEDLVDIARVTSEEFYAGLVLGFPFGMVFVDGDHEREAVMHDAGTAQSRLAPGGIIACHDYGNENTPGVAAALDSLYPDGPTRTVNSLWVREL